jgi:hypothetical protein
MYLAYSNKWHDTSDQVQIIESLKKKSVRDMFSLSSGYCDGNGSFVCALPIFVKLYLEKGNSGLYVSEKSINDPSGPFIYTPDIMGQVSRANFKEDCQNLIVRERATFKICLSNPFVFPIVLKNVYLLTDDKGTPRISEQISLTLPPMTKKRTISIGLSPNNRGPLKVLGFCATFMNVEIQFLVDSSGKILESSEVSSGLEFDVLDPQPNLKCLTDLSEQAFIRVYEGESILVPIQLENFGSAPVSSINFKFDDFKMTSDPFNNDKLINDIIFGNKMRTFEIDFNEISENLPIPGSADLDSKSHISFNLKINGMLSGSSEEHLKKSSLEIFYSASQSQMKESTVSFWRKLSIPVFATICPIVQIDQFSFFPYCSGATNSNIELIDTLNTEHKEDFCIASFVISNLESFPLNLCLKIKSSCSEVHYSVSSKSIKRLLFAIPRSDYNPVWPVKLDDKKIVSIRKLKRNDHKNFVDECFEDSLYESSLFWVKKYMCENIILEWSIFDQNSKNGICSFSQIDVAPIYHPNLFLDHSLIKVNCSEFHNIKLSQEVEVQFTINLPNSDAASKMYSLKLFPVVLLGDSVIGLNFEKSLLYTGCLDSIVRFNHDVRTEVRTFFFYPTSMATFKIIYQLIDLESGTIHWCNKPVDITTSLE